MPFPWLGSELKDEGPSGASRDFETSLRIWGHGIGAIFRVWWLLLDFRAIGDSGFS